MVDSIPFEMTRHYLMTGYWQKVYSTMALVFVLFFYISVYMAYPCPFLHRTSNSICTSYILCSYHFQRLVTYHFLTKHFIWTTILILGRPPFSMFTWLHHTLPDDFSVAHSSYEPHILKYWKDVILDSDPVIWKCHVHETSLGWRYCEHCTFVPLYL